MEFLIRAETPGDQSAIHDLTARAFAPMPYSDGDEQHLIDALRAADALTISLVAEQGDTIVGHIAFSPATAADGSESWYALGPVAVEPELQRQEIGSELVREGLALLRNCDAAGCILVGNSAYYSRFGFKPFPDLCPENEPAEFFMILPLRTTGPKAIMAFHPLFHG